MSDITFLDGNGNQVTLKKGIDFDLPEENVLQNDVVGLIERSYGNDSLISFICEHREIFGDPYFMVENLTMNSYWIIENDEVLNLIKNYSKYWSLIERKIRSLS